MAHVVRFSTSCPKKASSTQEPPGGSTLAIAANIIILQSTFREHQQTPLAYTNMHQKSQQSHEHTACAFGDNNSDGGWCWQLAAEVPVASCLLTFVVRVCGASTVNETRNTKHVHFLHLHCILQHGTCTLHYTPHTRMLYMHMHMSLHAAMLDAPCSMIMFMFMLMFMSMPLPMFMFMHNNNGRQPA